MFICDNCKKQFGIRIGKSKLNAGSRREEVIDEKEGTENWGNVVVIENVFAFKQVFPLHEATMLSDGVPKVRKPISPSKATIPVWTVATAS